MFGRISVSHAGTYGETYDVYLNITNPLQNGTNEITKEQLRNFVEAIAENEDYGIENYGYGATVESVVESVYGKGDFGSILDLNITCIGDMVEAVKLFNEVNGTDYNGIVAPTETVAFYPEQIKEVGNKKPTTDPDIRYSISADSEGNALTVEQQNKFGNSKVRDADGNLLTLYHGSESNAFTEFNMENGVWLTPDQRYSEVYAGKWHSWRDDVPELAYPRSDINGLEPEVYTDPDYRVYKVYADIQNPLDIGEIDGYLSEGKIGALARGLGVRYSELNAIANKYMEEPAYRFTRSKEFIDLAKSKGFDGLKATESGKETWCIIQSADQIKLTTNGTPTTNPDIRYSLSDSALDNNQNMVYNGERGEMYGSENGQGNHADFGNGMGGLQGYLETDDSRGKENPGRSVGLPKFVRLTPQTQEALSKSGVVSLELIDSSDDSNAFSIALEEARTSDERNGWAVTPKTAEELAENNVRTIMTTDSKAGLGVAPDGDIEAVFKNKNGGQARVLDTLIPAALEMGGTKLDCYGTGLVRLYAKYGFVPVARVTFNPEHANPGWSPDKGTPDIYFMVHNGDSADTVVANKGKYKQWTTEELHALPLYDKLHLLQSVCKLSITVSPPFN